MQVYHPLYTWYSLRYKDSGSYVKTTPNSELEFCLNKNIPIYTNNLHEALKFNAMAIADSFSQPLNVMFSGGIDSEVIVRINKDLGIKQNIYIMEYENNLNCRDVESAKEICKSLSVPYKIIKFNMKKFFEKKAESWYKKTYISRVEHIHRLELFQYFDNIVIVGDGEPYLKRDLKSDYTKKSPWHFRLDEHEFWFTMYSTQTNFNVLGSWYQLTPEIFANILRSNVVKNLTNDRLYGKQSTYSSRVPVYKEIWPDIKEKNKLVGFEGVDGPAGSLPAFMEEFKNTVMQGCTETPFEFSIEEFTRNFVWQQ